MEKNIFAYKPFFPLNISDFNFFGVCENCNPSPEEVTPLFPSNLPLKVEVLSSAGGGGGGCTLWVMGYLRNFCCIFSMTPILLPRHF